MKSSTTARQKANRKYQSFTGVISGSAAFQARNAWSLFNAITEIYKTVNPHAAISRGEALHGLFESRPPSSLLS